jgi:hypothetical protein
MHGADRQSGDRALVEQVVLTRVNVGQSFVERTSVTINDGENS